MSSDSPHKQFVTATDPQQIMDLVATGFEDCAPDRLERLQGSVTVPLERLESLAVQVHHDRQLAQFLGVCLRDVLPYAAVQVVQAARLELGKINAGLAMSDLEETRGKLEVVRDTYETARRRVHRAQDALAVLNGTTLFIEGTAEDAFDDAFHIRFED